ncbi:FAD-dependent monooxygenase [Nocardia sp. NPDC050710]|uniref:FAD-dependent monooxygenase n=1 Tax=Nocardia sp. NPDC050710 TaxID=3157220 RepID=UPI00340BDD21
MKENFAVTPDVVIVGAGPVGLMLAIELGLAGIRPIVLERLSEPSTEPKANGLVGQIVPMIDRRGLYESLSGSKRPPQPNSSYFMFSALPLDLSRLEQSPVYNLPAPQQRIVQVLEQRAVELGAEIRRGSEVVGLVAGDDTVTLRVSDATGMRTLHTRYLVGADGGRSAVRKLSGIDFPGVSYDGRITRTVHATVPAEWVDPGTGELVVPGYGRIRPFLPLRTETGGFSYAPFPGHPALVSTTEWQKPETEEPMTLADMRASIGRVLGVDLPLAPPSGDGPHVLRRMVGGNTRVAAAFRNGRIFLAGDAAHVFANGGGPGLNVGLQDSMNLGWKLAAELHGRAPSGLLDSYEHERRSAARRTVMSSQAQSALIAPGSDVTALRELFTELLDDTATIGHLAELIAGSDIRYAMGESAAHPLVGRCAPDLELITAAGPVRLAELTRTARPLLLDLTGDTTLAEVVAGWRDRVDVIAARPVAPDSGITGLLLRPDSYVAWASATTHPNAVERESLRAAMERWFGVGGVDREVRDTVGSVH